jgi:hypothetical protein
MKNMALIERVITWEYESKKREREDESHFYKSFYGEKCIIENG